MTKYHTRLHGHNYQFRDLGDVLAKASPLRSGDVLAGCAARSAAERVAAQMVLAEIPVADLLADPLIPPEEDVVSAVIAADWQANAAAPLLSLTVGELREWLLKTAYEPAAAQVFSQVAWGLTPELVAAVSKLMSNSELIAVSSAVQVTTAFRSTIGLPGTISSRLQPNHPADDPRAIALATVDGLSFGVGDAVIGINPATDAPEQVNTLLKLLDEIREHYEIPTQTCVLTHVTTTLELIEKGAPVDLVFQSLGGTAGTLASFGVEVPVLAAAQAAAAELNRGTVGQNVMYFETGQGSALSAGAHLDHNGFPLDQQTLEARAYGLARHFSPLLVNTVVGFIGPEYLYDGKQIIRAGLEDQFCGKLLGLQMGVDVCYTNHAAADQNDMDTLLHLLALAKTGFVIAVPGTDDVMLGYQSLSFHDVAQLRKVAGLTPAPEFTAWLERQQLIDAQGLLQPDPAAALSFAGALSLTSA